MVKPRENRVPIMMSADELKAVDDWRFENRIATRSDAVRRLVQIGLIFDSRVDALSRQALKAREALVGPLAELPPVERDALSIDFHGALVRAMEEQTELTREIIEAHNAVFPFSNAAGDQSMTDAKEESERRVMAFRERSGGK